MLHQLSYQYSLRKVFSTTMKVYYPTGKAFNPIIKPEINITNPKLKGK